MIITRGSTDCRRLAGGRRRGSPIAWLSSMLLAGAGLSAQAVPTCTIASGATLSFGAMVLSLLGVDQFAGGVSGALMDAIGCVVLLTALGLGLLRGWWPRARTDAVAA